MEGICVREIAEATGGLLLCGSEEQPVRHISIDSRTMRGEDLFVPLIGEKNDAHRFLIQAMENGAVCALSSEHETAPEGFAGALIRVEDTKKALQALGHFLRSRLSLPVVGITGSVGKTTTREMVAAALSAGYRTFKTPGNHNSQVGVPITVSEISAEDEIAVLELGMSEPGEMEPIAKIAAVDVAVMTNIGVTHIENLGSRENILKEKLHIQDGMKNGGILIVNGDNDMLKTVTAREGCTTLRYGLEPYNDYRAEELTFVEGCPSFVMVHGETRIPVRLSVMGEHNVLNALAALAVADHFRVDLIQAAEKLREFGGFKNRQQICEADGIIVIDDTYNASPDSMKAGIRVLSTFTDRARRVAVLADMKELGEQTREFHEEVGEFLAEQPVDLLITYGSLAESIADGAGRRAAAECSGDRTALTIVRFAESEKEKMTEYLEENLRPGDAVLFKGSNSMKLFETAAVFTAKGKKR
ncbi:MAG: UDP-N-acetylmuramoyl-tripeptide--D-alanyl-D-alanine ligase [Otoolea sp.]|nr:UDP-N-acetylmuramoyl-tripeptide--D-alanyl-D-alanine ligase [Clostridiaceae bacterium]MDY5483291.1 UDP-N-acetylmuramoyl-tripeptide--D-alanyl-D-alanine ligase [Clostridium sp.]